MFRTDVMRGVIEIDEIVCAHIHRANAETGDSAIEQVKVDKSFERRSQRSGIVIAENIRASARRGEGRRHAGIEETRSAAKQCAQRAQLIEPSMDELVLDLD